MINATLLPNLDMIKLIIISLMWGCKNFKDLYIKFFVLFAGGLLYIRDSSNLQYVTTSSMLLFIYSKILTAAHINGLQCGSVHFSTSQLRAFAKSQVDTTFSFNRSPISKFHDHVRPNARGSVALLTNTNLSGIPVRL